MLSSKSFQSSSSSGSRSSEDVELEEKVGFLDGAPKQWNGRRGSPSPINRYWTIFNSLLFSSSIAIFFSSQDFGRNALLKKTAFYSPILDMVDIPVRVQRMDADFYPGPNPTVGRQSPNPEADAVWEEWEIARTVVVTADEIRKLGKDPSVVVKLDDNDWHLGDDAYMTTMDIFHQLHCLNSLRKLIYPEYYNYTREQSRVPELWYFHLNHCVDILMQNIQCTGNTDLVTMQWRETQSIPFPDFNINHQCRDFDALVEWRKANSLDIDEWVKYSKKPEGVKQALQQEKYFEIFGEQDREGSISPAPV